jgi:N-acetylglucosaminyl-diphospho-decaprenol L-rhamnosyltransferase
MKVNIAMDEGRDNTALSIVIVNSDGLEMTINCLESIFQHPFKEHFEVILVDNCSDVTCIPVVNQKFPQVKTLSSEQKQGFAKNYNLGIKIAEGEYILVLNNDTIIHPGALTALVDALRQNEPYGMVGPKLLSENGEIQSVCARALITPVKYILIQFLLDLSLPTGKIIDRINRWKLKRKSSGPVACISGACMLVKREALEKVGLLDEGYDFYYEDIEWCHRLILSSYKVAYIAEAEITHFGDSSLSRVKVWAKQSEYQSALRYFKTYHGLTRWKHWIVWLTTLFSYHFRWVAFAGLEVFTGDRGHRQAYRQLARWITTQIPSRVTLTAAGQPPSADQAVNNAELN